MTFAEEINAVLHGLGKNNISDVRLVETPGGIPALAGYSDVLLFIGLKNGNGLVFRLNPVKTQFELWQGSQMFQKQQAESTRIKLA